MNTLTLILLIVIYLLIVYITYKPFKLLEDKYFLDTAAIAIWLWPFMWVLIIIIALYEGFAVLFKRK